MKKFVNGEYIEMTEAEIAEIQARASEYTEPQETVEELIAKLEELRREQDFMIDRLRSMVQTEEKNI